MGCINNQLSGAAMLNQLSIQNFAIVEHLELELQSGMTVITGETGAGKSIMLDALALALGGRADSSVVPAGKARTEIAASIDVQYNRDARQWLAVQQLEADAGAECLLRRVISADGRSRAWVNGQPVTLQQLRELGSQLVDIHSQHEHQSLLLRDTHRHLLDAYAHCSEQARAVRESYQQWKALHEHVQNLRSQSDDHNARRQLLRYQVEELDQLDLQLGELTGLEQEQEQLASVESSLQTGQQVLDICKHGESETVAVMDLLDRALLVLANQKAKSPALSEAEKMLDAARIQVEEACREVERHQGGMEINPERLQEVETRMSQVYQIARKHRVAADELVALHEKLGAELLALSGGENSIEVLEQQLAQQLVEYQRVAASLSEARAAGAAALAKAVNRELKRLNMQGCQFTVALEARLLPAVTGVEQVEFMVSTNPGQPFMPLKKVASGGELSRLSLAIQVVTAQTSAIPTLVFDEVDVGIGGETAAVVGQLLRKLGENGQVICVTHQASVAAKAHQHLFVTKAIHQDAQGKRGVKTTLMALGEQDRINEVARMIGGQQTAESRAHAEVMLKAS
jgi:DNA repair protein RecN (Recombination protein N)